MRIIQMPIAETNGARYLLLSLSFFSLCLFSWSYLGLRWLWVEGPQHGIHIRAVFQNGFNIQAVLQFAVNEEEEEEEEEVGEEVQEEVVRDAAVVETFLFSRTLEEGESVRNLSAAIANGLYDGPIERQGSNRLARLLRDTGDSLREIMGSKTECSICLQHYDAAQTVSWPRTEGCNHVFHQDCIVPWLCKQDNCPLCRTNLLQGDLGQEEKEHCGVSFVSCFHERKAVGTDCCVDWIDTEEALTYMSTLLFHASLVYRLFRLESHYCRHVEWEANSLAFAPNQNGTFGYILSIFYNIDCIFMNSTGSRLYR